MVLPLFGMEDGLRVISDHSEEEEEESEESTVRVFITSRVTSRHKLCHTRCVDDPKPISSKGRHHQQQHHR